MQNFCWKATYSQKDIVKIIFEKFYGSVDGIIWLRMGTGGGHVNIVLKLQALKMAGNFQSGYVIFIFLWTMLHSFYLLVITADSCSSLWDSLRLI